MSGSGFHSLKLAYTEGWKSFRVCLRGTQDKIESNARLSTQPMTPPRVRIGRGERRAVRGYRNDGIESVHSLMAEECAASPRHTASLCLGFRQGSTRACPVKTGNGHRYS